MLYELNHVGRTDTAGEEDARSSVGTSAEYDASVGRERDDAVRAQGRVVRAHTSDLTASADLEMS